MILNKKIETEVLKVYDTWMHSYLHGDVETYDSFLDDAYHFIGSAKNEEFLNRRDTTKFFEDTGDQFAGKTEIRDENKTIEYFGELIFITHIFDGWFLNENDWTFYARFRFTSVLKNTKDGWRFIYQHFSIPDSKTGEGETIGYDKINDENQELREAIARRTFELEAKNRELEIEGALERIRAQATAMKVTTDLLDIVVAMRHEFIKLGHEAHYFWHMMWLKNTYEKAMTSGDGTRIGFVMNLPRHIHGNIPLLANWEKSNHSTVVYAMDSEEAINYVDKMVALGDFKNIDPQAPSHNDIRHIGGLTFIMARTSHGEIGYSLPGKVKNPPKEDLHILERFASAFDLAHRRFLDLQKAEQQAREVEIELALEKVRSRTMAMQKSEELADVATVLFQQVKSLGIEQWTCGFNIWETGDTEFTFYPGGPDGELLPSCKVPLLEHPIFRQFDASRRRGDELFVYEKEGDIQKDHYKYMHSLPGMGDMLQNMLDQGMEFPDYQIDHVANFAYGNIVFITYEPFPEMHDVFKRFAKVFEQTYTRFLDLQKAEAQAREAQIETALERVRSRSMAMQKSDELEDVILEVLKKLQDLGISMEQRATAIFTFEDGNKDYEQWVASPEYKSILSFNTPYFDHPIQNDIWKARKNSTEFYAKPYSVEEKNSLFTFLFNLPALKHMPEAEKTKALGFEHYSISIAFQKHAALVVVDHSGVPLTEAENTIILRLNKVFHQAYTRFLDLQKAEAQAQEAKIEAALEKVRSRTMAMQKGEEVKDVVVLLYKELIALGVTNFATCGYVEINEETRRQETWVTNPGGDSLGLFYLPLTGDVHFDARYKAWKKQQTVFHQTVAGEERKKHLEYAITTFNSKEAEEMVLNQFPDPTVFYCFNFSHGYLHLVAGSLLTKDEEILLARFTRVFEQTYARFLDLQKSEAQAREAQIEMALEKVRSRTMAMQKSSELPEAANNLFLQVQELGIPAWSAGYCIWEDDQQKSASCNMSSEGEIQKGFSLPTIGEGYDFYKPLKNKESFHVSELGGEALVKHYDFMKTLPIVGEVLDDFDKKGIALPTFQIFHIVYFTHGYLMFITYEAVPSDWEVFKRFGKVFQQTYTRFLDLKKSEAQTRKAQIEVAVERIRAQSMAMHHPDDLENVNSEIYNQLQLLNIKGLSGVSIWLVDKDNFVKIWDLSSPGNMGDPSSYSVAYDTTQYDILGEPIRILETSKDDYFVFHYPLEKLKKAIKEWAIVDQRIANDFKNALKTGKLKEQWNPFARHNNGILAIDLVSPPNEDTKTIITKIASAFNQAYTRFLDLQKAEAQTREAQIEAALERTRTQSMLMQHSDELNTTAQVFHEQLQLLGIDSEFSYLWLPDEAEKNHMFWATWSETKNKKTIFKNKAVTFPLDKSEPSIEACYAAWESEEKVHSNPVKPNEVANYFSTWTELLHGVDKFKPELFPEGLYYIDAYMNYGCFGIMIRHELSAAEKIILSRFSKEFQRTYTRFLDLQKAEAQAREAQIEAALERVRSRSMAMHNSDEIGDVAFVLFQQLKSLGGEFWGTGFGFCEKNSKVDEFWFANENGIMPQLKVPNTKDAAHKEMYQGWINNLDLLSIEKGGKALERHYDYMLTVPDVQPIFQGMLDDGLAFPKWQKWHAAYFKYGYLLAITTETYENEDIFKRFAKVFEQAYTRFLDLQKAEKQTREAQIEAALEKVRSRSLAMHKPEELQEVVAIVAEKLKELGVIFDAGGVILCTYFPDNKDVVHWIAVPDFSSSGRYFVPYFDNPIFNDAWDSKSRGDAYFSKEFTVEAKNAFFKHAFENSDYRDMPDDYKEFVLSADRHHLSAAWSENSAIIIPSLTGAVPTENNAQIMERFAKVFEQAYIRFMDLQQAEIREKEAIKQASLDRVRGEIASMRTTTDLERITPLIWKELTALGVPFFRCGVFIVREDESMVHAYLSKPDSTSVAALHIPFNDNDNKLITPTIENWRLQQAYKETWNQEQFIQQTHLFLEKGQIENPDTYDISETPPEQLVLHLIPFKQGMVYVGNHEDLTDDQVALVDSLSQAFSVAYSRYEDFKTIETANNRLELTINDLKSAQAQLIQAEKMASLGELTAGIAHEIQNPLNFVNNFSEVSEELVDEMNEELENGGLEEAKAISQDLKNNLSKINHHGKRADAIVKGMLEHSRINKGQKKPTDINALLDEFVRLSYHGLRAKDKSFNADFKLKLDPNLPKVNVVSSDIGRVILNLVNNAFYACTERSRSACAERGRITLDRGVKTYNPEVIVSSEQTENGIQLSVRDNGGGIPEKVRDKIFQPFFTTKPTGKGTGLGLSLSYDIIKAHGGKLTLESTEGEGTMFSIKIPIL